MFGREFLLDKKKMEIFKKGLKSISFLWGGAFLGSGSTFIIYIILARELGVESFGVIGTAISLMTVFSMLIGFGVPRLWLKIFGEHGWAGLLWVPATIKFITITFIVAMMVLLLWIILGAHDSTMQIVLCLMSLFMLGRVCLELVSSKLQLEERYKSLALWQLLPNLMRLTIIYFIIYVFDFTIDVVDVSLVYAVVGLVFVAAGIVQVREMMHGKIRLKGHGEKIFTSYKRYSTSDVVRLTWPFGLASILSFVYVQSDLIMVKYIVGDSEAGFYNVAAVIYMSIMILPTVIYQKFFVSKYHRWASHNKGLLLTAYKKGNAIMLLLGVGVMIACVLSSDYIVVVLFGGQYEKSVYLVNILLVAVPFSFVAYSAGAVLVTKDNMKIKIKKMGVVAVINILLNVMLIPEYHAKGAAVATLISSMILLLLYLYAAQRNIFNGYAR